MQKVVGIEVAAYPDCMNTGCNVMAVICHTVECDQYAVYVGIVRLGEYDPDRPELYQAAKRYAAEFVAQRGQKQTMEQAQKYFTFPTRKYRE